MNTEALLERISQHCDALTKVAHKLRSKNDRASHLAMQAIDAAHQWLTEAATEHEARDPFKLHSEDEAA